MAYAHVPARRWPSIDVGHLRARAHHPIDGIDHALLLGMKTTTQTTDNGTHGRMVLLSTPGFDAAHPDRRCSGPLSLGEVAAALDGYIALESFLYADREVGS